MNPATRCWELARRSLDGLAAGGQTVLDHQMWLMNTTGIRETCRARRGPRRPANDLQELRWRRTSRRTQSREQSVLAAGAVLWRPNGDASAPESRSSTALATTIGRCPRAGRPGETNRRAVREIQEETGYSSHLGRRLAAGPVYRSSKASRRCGTGRHSAAPVNSHPTRSRELKWLPAPKRLSN